MGKTAYKAELAVEEPAWYGLNSITHTSDHSEVNRLNEKVETMHEIVSIMHRISACKRKLATLPSPALALSWRPEPEATKMRRLEARMATQSGLLPESLVYDLRVWHENVESEQKISAFEPKIALRADGSL